MTERSQMPDKSLLRAAFTKRREALDPAQRRRLSSAACEHAVRLLQRGDYETVMAYVPFRSELDVRPLIEWCWRQGRVVVVPRCVKADRSMTLHRLGGWDQLAAGAYGIMEPDPEKTPALPEGAMPDAVIVPGLAFDRQGGRMGYGGGYYDRFAQAALRAGHAGRRLWLGIAFEAQLADEVPMERHDVRLHGVITEEAVYWRDHDSKRGG